MATLLRGNAFGLVARELAFDSPEDFGPLQMRQKLRKLTRSEELVSIIVLPNGNDGSPKTGGFCADLKACHPLSLIVFSQLPECWAHDRNDQSDTREFSEL